jgi:hypothetical protein
MTERRFSAEVRRAMFWALLAARAAGEPQVTAPRVAAALLRCESMASLRADVDAPEALPFDECARRVAADLARRGIALGSPEHIQETTPLPLHPSVQAAIEAVTRADADAVITPHDVFHALLAADPELARRAGDA